jgi:hypothetical protein
MVDLLRTLSSRELAVMVYVRTFVDEGPGWPTSCPGCSKLAEPARSEPISFAAPGDTIRWKS